LTTYAYYGSIGSIEFFILLAPPGERMKVRGFGYG